MVSVKSFGGLEKLPPFKSRVKPGKESKPFPEILPVGIVQLLMTVEFLVVTVNEPGAKIPERGRKRMRAEKMTIIGLKKTA
jgi:hypothetical protein